MRTVISSFARWTHAVSLLPVESDSGRVNSGGGGWGGGTDRPTARYLFSETTRDPEGSSLSLGTKNLENEGESGNDEKRNDLFIFKIVGLTLLFSHWGGRGGGSNSFTSDPFLLPPRFPVTEPR